MGTSVLMILPTSEGSHLSPIDALFTATSATCVTGLVVVDTGKDLSFWGQIIVLILIQTGGLGITILSTLLLLALGHSISFRSRLVVEETYSFDRRADLYVLVRNVIVFTFVFEAIGFLVLYMRFREQLGAGPALFQSLFHAISAFCNAGFSLFSDSLMSYRQDFMINLTMGLLIIIGGLGFIVLHELVHKRKKAQTWAHYWTQLSVHTKIALSMSLFLLIGGTLLFACCEWYNTLHQLPLPEKILAAFFQSITTRTAGFNTLDFGSMSDLSLLGTMILMFIGASPGSTGGGIKTTTIGVLLALCCAGLKGSDHVFAFKRAIPAATVDRAFSVSALSVVIVIVGMALLLLLEGSGLPFTSDRSQFLELLFETISAFGTVGLSMGVTPGLSAWGKLTLVLVMFTGRLGPLVLVTAIQLKRGSRGTYHYAEEPVMIG
jgi:trk system potassium uptake protein TrkH